MASILAGLGALALHDGTAAAQAPAAPAPEAAPAASASAGDDAAKAQQEAEAARTMSAIDAEAREHFQLGRSFYEQGSFQQAAEEFEIAYRLSARPQLLYNVYVARRDAGNQPMAIDALRGY
jgi:tetratricopeptide (TPR) repeat protein